MENKKCKAQRCDELATTCGYCPKHYQQIKRRGRLLSPEDEYKKRGHRCKVEDCERQVIARGYCMRHYTQVRRHGRLTPEKERVWGRRGCVVPECKKPHVCRGYCKRHYMTEYYLPLKRKEMRSCK